ncbi:hypothetical protein K7I14_21375 [Aurantimonas coralicida]|nr:hypothetical protein [Aurantimonas coralicida]
MARNPIPAPSRATMSASGSPQGFLHQTRRGFLSASLTAVGLLALPAALRPAKSASFPAVALAFDGKALLVAGATLSRSDDAGRTRSTLPGPDGILALATHPERPSRIVAGLASGRVAISQDGGRTWKDRAIGNGEGAIDAITMAAGQPDMMYAAIRGDGLWKSEDAGRNWGLAMDRPWLDNAERDLRALASVDLATGMGGIWIYAGTDTGITRVPDCFCRWQDVQPGNAMDALVAGDAPPPEAPLPSGEPVRALAGAHTASETLYAALPSGVWSSRDAGVVWSRLTSGDASAVAVNPSNPEYLVAALDGGLKQSRDRGTTWSALATS